MNKIMILLTLLLVGSGCSNTSSKVKSVNNQWNHQKRENHLDNRRDSTSWDKEMLEDDRQSIMDGDFGPFELGVFPQPKYDLIGKDSFKGMGNKSGQF